MARQKAATLESSRGGRILNLALSLVLALGLMPALSLGGAQEAYANDEPAAYTQQEQGAAEAEDSQGAEADAQEEDASAPAEGGEPAQQQAAGAMAVSSGSGEETGAAEALESSSASVDLVFTNGVATISKGGTYQLAAGASGTVVVKTTEAVTIVGNGATWNTDQSSSSFGTMTSTPNANLMIDCSQAQGACLTLKDLYISNKVATMNANTVNFAGEGNKLVFDGVVVIDHDGLATGYAGIHVGAGVSLNISGTSGSSFYMYKFEQGAGIGANNGEACGTITFGVKDGKNDFSFFMKGSKQGAVIGNGANCSETPGDITFYSGVYNLAANARGALVGGSAGTSSQAAGNVYVYGGLLNLNVDFSGAAIGGGGYDGGNDKGGGNAYLLGGSVRTYIDANAIGSWNVGSHGVNDKAITANKCGSEGEAVYLMAVPTSDKASSHSVKLDGKSVYEGPGYSWRFYKEDGSTNELPAGTPGNWTSLADEANLYIYASGDEHVVEVDGTTYAAAWDEDAEAFTLEKQEETSAAWDGKTVDVSWYNATDTSFNIATPAQLMGLAAIVNGKVNSDITTVIDADAEGSTQSYAIADYLARESSKIKAVWWDDSANSTGGQQSGWCGADTFAGKTVYLTSDLDMGGVYDSETKEWSGARFMPIGCKACLDVAVDSDSSKDDKNWISSIFCGSLDGQGHWVNNIYTGNLSCDTYSADVALIGQLGAGDVQGQGSLAGGLFVRNVVVGPGYINADRSVAGVVGKVGSTKDTVVIENCANYATIIGHQKKGTGGVVGAAWNDLVVKNCYNAGSVSGSQQTGGVCGANEATTINCYNIGTVTCSSNAKYGGAIAYSNGGDTYQNCYWLTGSAPNGVDGKSGVDVVEKTSDDMKTAEFLASLNGDGRAWVADSTENPVNGGYPILRVMAGADTAKVESVTYTGMVKTAYVEGQAFSAESKDSKGEDKSFKVWAKYSDGTQEALENYSVLLDGETIDVSEYEIALADDGKTVAVSGEAGSVSYSFSLGTLSVEQNYPLEIKAVTGAPQSMTFAVGQKVTWPTQIRVSFYNGKTTYIKPDTAEWANVSVSHADALTAGNDGDAYAVSYALNGKAATYEVGTLKVVSAVASDEQGVYELRTVDDMLWFAAQVNDIYRGLSGEVSGKLMNDIDLSQVAWVPMGTSFIDSYYDGVFDGQGHKVTLKIESASQFQGLFGVVGTGAVRNVTVSGSVKGGTYAAGIAAKANGSSSFENCVNEAEVQGSSYIGGIVGYAYQGATSIKGCVNSASVSATANYAGGIVGQGYTLAKDMVISGCSNNGSVSAKSYAGGIIGAAVGKVAACENDGIVSASTSCAGGIAGSNQTSAVAYSSCANYGNVTAPRAAAGIVGYGSNQMTVDDCYNAGAITATAETAVKTGDAGGIAGYVNNAQTAISNSYSIGKVSGSDYSAELVACDTKGVVLTNCYYLNGEAAVAHAVTASTVSTESDTAFGKTADELKASDAVALLNGERTGDAAVWAVDVAGVYALNGGYPVLTWQLGDVEVLLGDVNLDGLVDVVDLGMLINHCTGKTLLPGTSLAAADINGDGSVDVVDLGMLINHCTGKSTIQG